jgi:hypothetical protein
MVTVTGRAAKQSPALLLAAFPQLPPKPQPSARHSPAAEQKPHRDLAWPAVRSKLSATISRFSSIDTRRRRSPRVIHLETQFPFRGIQATQRGARCSQQSGLAHAPCCRSRAPLTLWCIWFASSPGTHDELPEVPAREHCGGDVLRRMRCSTCANLYQL